MSVETLISSYILRLSVHRNRWRIGLHHVRSGEVVMFDSFDHLAAYLERLSSELDGFARAPPPEADPLKQP